MGLASIAGGNARSNGPFVSAAGLRSRASTAFPETAATTVGRSSGAVTLATLGTDASPRGSALMTSGLPALCRGGVCPIEAGAGAEGIAILGFAGNPLSGPMAPPMARTSRAQGSARAIVTSRPSELSASDASTVGAKPSVKCAAAVVGWSPVDSMFPPALGLRNGVGSGFKRYPTCKWKNLPVPTVRIGAAGRGHCVAIRTKPGLALESAGR